MGEFKKVEKIKPFVLKKKDPKTYSCLKELFVDWQEAHKNDDDWERTFPEVPKDKATDDFIASFYPHDSYDGEFKSSFCPDGPLSDNFNSEDGVKILFICREPNVTGDIESNVNSNKDFWFKNVVGVKAERSNDYYPNNDLSRFEKRTQTKYTNCMSRIANAFNFNSEDSNKPYENLKQCAYMNINKRGGFGSCNFERLENYFLKYENYILKEIELINPNKIVILGNLPEYIETSLTTKAEELKKPIYLYNLHPCVYTNGLINKLEENPDDFKLPIENN